VSRCSEKPPLWLSGELCPPGEYQDSGPLARRRRTVLVASFCVGDTKARSGAPLSTGAGSVRFDLANHPGFFGMGTPIFGQTVPTPRRRGGIRKEEVVEAVDLDAA
jgi:hypothetical protein